MTKRFVLALCAVALALPLVGCRHRCCKSESASFAPPPAGCCDGRPSSLPPVTGFPAP